MKLAMKFAQALSLLLPLSFSLLGCSTLGLSSASTPLEVKAAFVNDCEAFNKVLAIELSALSTHELTLAEATDLNTAQAKIVPICEAPPPADATAVITQITAATATLTANALSQGLISK